MFDKIKTFCLNSLTMAWGYFLSFIGALLQLVDTIGDALGDPALKEQISAAIGDPTTVGRLLLGVSIITILARLHSIRKQP